MRFKGRFRHVPCRDRYSLFRHRYEALGQLSQDEPASGLIQGLLEIRDTHRPRTLRYLYA